jgi:hypothetical protein
VATTKTRRRSRYKDEVAADYIRRRRVHAGLSRNEFANVIKQRAIKEGVPPRRARISPDLIRLVEETGHEPGPQVKFLIALYLEKQVGHIWERDYLASFDGPMEAAAA